MAASKIDKPRAEVNYVRKGLMLAMKERKLSAYLVADLLQMHRSNISKFLVSKTQLNDEAIEMLYEKGLVARPTEQDLEKAQAQEPISPDGKDGIEYIPIADLRPHPANQLIYGDCADEDLVDSIRENGVLSPLLVTTGGILVSGHRRLDAARRAGLGRARGALPAFRGVDDDADELQHVRNLVGLGHVVGGPVPLDGWAGLVGVLPGPDLRDDVAEGVPLLADVHGKGPWAGGHIMVRTLGCT